MKVYNSNSDSDKLLPGNADVFLLLSLLFLSVFSNTHIRSGIKETPDPIFILFSFDSSFDNSFSSRNKHENLDMLLPPSSTQTGEINFVTEI